MNQYITKVEEIKDGSVIVEEDTWAYYAYILKTGKAKVWKSNNGKQVLIGVLKEGDIFGEMSFFGMANRVATVTADGNVTVEMIAKDTFMEAFAKLPEDVRSKIDKMSTSLFYLNDVYCRLSNSLHEISDIKGGMTDPKTFEKEVENMPGFLREIIILMHQRFHTVIGRSVKLMSQLEETSKSIDSVSLALVHE